MKLRSAANHVRMIMVLFFQPASLPEMTASVADAEGNVVMHQKLQLRAWCHSSELAFTGKVMS